MKSRGRWAALAVGTVALLLALGCVLFRSYLVDQWHIFRLKNGDPQARAAAAARLGERKCLKAIPLFIDLLLKDEREGVAPRRRLPRTPDGSEVVALGHIGYSLYRMGSEGMAPVRQYLESIRFYDVEVARQTDILEAILKAWENPRVTVVEAASRR